METITIQTKGKKYPVYIENGILSKVGCILERDFKLRLDRPLGIVTDRIVYGYHGDVLKQILESHGYNVHFFIINAGEKSKSLETITYLTENLLQKGFVRGDTLIAFGGGVVGDITGFLASIYLRGISYIQMPTSLLAQVDSALGGKTAVNTVQGKNLLGTFYHPDGVITDPNLLKTLSIKFLKDGMGEVIKYACIDKPEFFDQLMEWTRKSYNKKLDKKKQWRYESAILEKRQEIIKACCLSKKDFIEKDEMDTGQRLMLNFGHTFGHAIEAVQGYGVCTHGQAVAMGMYYMVKIGEKRGWTKEGTVEKLKRLLEQNGLFDKSLLKNYTLWIKHIENDKKNSIDGLRVVFIKEIGKPMLQKMTTKDLIKSLIDTFS